MTLVSTGATRLVAVLLTVAFVVGAIPLMISNDPIVENASAQTGGYVKVGWIGEFMNWNPMTVEFVSDWVAYNLIFSTLFQYDEDWDEIHNHLATGYYQVEWPSGNMSTYINITENAYFRNAVDDEDTSHKLTAEDVKFTIDLMRTVSGHGWEYYVYNITGTYVINEYQVQIDTEYPKATLIDDLVWVPILPKFQWETFTGGAVIGHMNPEDLIGSGAFYYEDGAKNDWHRFKKAPNFHGTADYGEARDIDYEGIQFQIFTNVDGLVFGINSGALDVVDVSGAQMPAWEAIVSSESVPITKQVTQELGIYDIAINAIPLELRQKIGYAESGNHILLDRTVRKAIGMTLNKDLLETLYFHNMADQADTVLNPGFWHANLSNPLPFDPAAAMDMLIAAGYEDTDGDDYLEVTEDSLAYTDYGAALGAELEFRLDVPDSDPAYTTIGQAWVSWAAQAGIKFDFNSYPAGPFTNDIWYQCEYDLWVWSWYWGPEPLSNLACWLTNQVREGGYNCVGPICQGGLNEPDGWWWEDYDNAVARCGFDDTFDEALRTNDINARKVLVDELQEAIYETYTEFPPLHPAGLYAFTTMRYDGWGNWEEHVARTIISDMLWIWYDLEPVEANSFPVFDTSLSSGYDREVDVPITFEIEVSDLEGDEITVNWTAGDGGIDEFESMTVSGDTTQPSWVEWTYTYETVGTYNLTVGLSDPYHEYENIQTAVVNVLPEPNLGPTLEGLTVSPLRAYVDDETTWSIWASDHEQGPDGEGLLFTWDWGDGTYTTQLHQPVANDTMEQDEQTHTWDAIGEYDVSVWVWDGASDQNDPTHNVSVHKTYSVYENMPPTAPMATNISGLEGQPIACEAVASDPDPDSLRFTWDWGDGSFNVTNHDMSSKIGEEATSTVEHEWTAAGTYPVVIYVDDGEGHNVSTTVYAIILAAGEEAPPGSISIKQSPNPATVDLPVMLTVGASDPNEDALTVTIDFGDDSDLGVNNTAGATSDMQYAEFSHIYDEEGVYTVTVYIDDGSHNVSASKNLTVAVNKPPEILLASAYSFYYNESKTVRPVSASDPDGDPLTVWYDWGDDSSMTMGDPEDGYASSHAYNATGNFELTAWADDGKRNNESAVAAVTVYEANMRPQLVEVTRSDPAGDSYVPGEVIYFNVTVSDKEGDYLTIMLDFGDGSTPETFEFDSDPLVNRTVEFSYAYEEGRESAYSVTASVMDDQDHSDMTPISQTILITVEEEDEGGGIDVLLLLIIPLIVLVLLVTAFVLMKRKGRGREPSIAGDMEGMTPSEMAEEAGSEAEIPAPPEEEPPQPG
ncbi:MAG: PKD domain-containing protein [Methanobacteriota archaeon]|nr:MAG: PKD domain-containing protein [Euryarchaeota archaeon]